MIGVIDTSAVIRLFVEDGPLPPGLEQLLLDVERGNATAIAPELMWAEAANVLHKKLQRGELAEDEACELLDEVVRLPILSESHPPLLARSFEIAEEAGLTVYDALFLALAEARGGVVFTGDHELQAAAQQRGLTNE